MLEQAEAMTRTLVCGESKQLNFGESYSLIYNQCKFGDKKCVFDVLVFGLKTLIALELLIDEFTKRLATIRDVFLFFANTALASEFDRRAGRASPIRSINDVALLLKAIFICECERERQAREKKKRALHRMWRLALEPGGPAAKRAKRRFEAAAGVV